MFVIISYIFGNKRNRPLCTTSNFIFRVWSDSDQINSGKNGDCPVRVDCATLIYCGRFIVSIIKLLVVVFEGRLLKRNRIQYFQRKFITLQLLTTIGIVMVFAYYNYLVTVTDPNFLTSLYFTFVTVSTIGFGDIVHDPLYYFELSMLEIVMTGLFEFTLIFSAMSLVSAMISAVMNIKAEESRKKKIRNTVKDEVITNGHSIT